MVPESLLKHIGPVTVIVGHYGAGKTNFTVNLALDLSAAGRDVTVVDLDIVNPYFRASEQRATLEASGVKLIAPVFAEAGTSLDVPSLTGRIEPAIRGSEGADVVLVDAGGDDVGATALGRFSRAIRERGYAMLYVANRFRNLVADPHDALENLREIEAASHLSATALVNNSHLKDATTEGTIRQGSAYAADLSALSELPLACTTTSISADSLRTLEDAYPIRMLVCNPWESGRY